MREGADDDGMTEEPEGEALAVWVRWLAERPARVRSVIAKFPPWRSFKIKATGQVVRVTTWSEVLDGVTRRPTGEITLKVRVLSDPRGPFTVGFEVFGIQQSDIEPA